MWGLACIYIYNLFSHRVVSSTVLPFEGQSCFLLLLLRLIPSHPFPCQLLMVRAKNRPGVQRAYFETTRNNLFCTPEPNRHIGSSLSWGLVVGSEIHMQGVGFGQTRSMCFIYHWSILLFFFFQLTWLFFFFLFFFSFPFSRGGGGKGEGQGRRRVRLL